MNKFTSLAVGMGLAIILPATTWAVCEDDPDNVHEGHFEGHTQHATSPSGSYAVGEFVTAYQIIEAVQVNPWYPFDQTNYEYTLVVQLQVSAWVVTGPVRQLSFNPGTFAIYEDAGTAANYANTATFTDGPLILSGTVATANPWVGLANGPNPPPDGVGGTGLVTITGGSGLGNALCTELNMTDFITWLPQTSPTGFKERFGSMWTCCVDPTSAEQSTWGRTKGQYR